MQRMNTQNDVLNESGFILSLVLQHAEEVFGDCRRRRLLCCVRNITEMNMEEVNQLYETLAQATMLPLCDVSRLFICFCSFFINRSFWSSCSSKSWKEKQDLFKCFVHTRHSDTCIVSHTILSAVNCEVSCLSLLLASLSICSCLFKWSFSSPSSSTLPLSSLFNSSSSSLFSSKCLTSNKIRPTQKWPSLL